SAPPTSPSSTRTRASRTWRASTSRPEVNDAGRARRRAASVVAARPAAAGVAAASSGKAIASTSPAAAPSAAGRHHRHLLARNGLVELTAVAALPVRALLADVRDAFAPVGGRLDDLLVDGHPRPVARTAVTADRGPDHRHDDEPDDERQPPRAAAR